ncbi:unnamed protein product [Soboliphyme baturini]|uniref:Ald_Xan_dh_C domain-containing protein n=1 Tax=Soboliphyme baturini TaxID=241478 RepID=A0A183IYA1_9BILA|nr:unnamed protein product [Soboliphyme baturini]
MGEMMNRVWNAELFKRTCSSLISELSLLPGTIGGMERFRMSLCLTFFYKFYLAVTQNICRELNIPCSSEDITAEAQRTHRMLATQFFEEEPIETCSNDKVGKAINHLAAGLQVSGEATYCDDLDTSNALHMAFVLSRRAHAKVIWVDTKEALSVDGVVAYVDHHDIPSDGSNLFGVAGDQLVFAVDEVVVFFGQIIGAIVASDRGIAKRACTLVKVTYENLPVILTVENAIENNSFLEGGNRVCRGRVAPAFSQSDFTLEGEVKIGGQEHFYFETQSCIVTPCENDELEVVSSTQNASEMQVMISKILAIAQHKISVKVKRIGGGFGGKETSSLVVALPVAVAARKLMRPVSCVLERFDDMVMTGTRHPCLGRYKMGFEATGKFSAYNLQFFANCGSWYDLSCGVTNRALMHSDNCYNFPNFYTSTKLCRTNFQPCTAFRGFGAPQAMFMLEHCITDVAYTLNIRPEKVRKINLYDEGDRTPWGEAMKKCKIRSCWTECMNMSKFHDRINDVENFNRNHISKKRGICVIPTKFGIAFGVKFMNQAGAQVNIYLDGSVIINHGGIEMGQGLHTKIVQIATRVLNVPPEMIHIKETSTLTVPNTSPSAASASSDLNGMAVKNACEVLVERLRFYMEKDPNNCWSSWVQAAYEDRVSLSASGFYKYDFDGYDYEKQIGSPFHYYVYGVACTEVEIDCLTGSHEVIRTDIVMDIGRSLNPAVDIGQIEGAFIQGYGLCTMEEIKVSPTGVVYTRGPGTYKIPSAADIPQQFNVKLLKNSDNDFAIYSSKAVGEPPLFLGLSVYFAIKDAIRCAREQEGLTGPFRLDSPASCERIRLACTDKLLEMVLLFAVCLQVDQ